MAPIGIPLDVFAKEARRNYSFIYDESGLDARVAPVAVRCGMRVVMGFCDGGYGRKEGLIPAKKERRGHRLTRYDLIINALMSGVRVRCAALVRVGLRGMFAYAR